MDNNTNFEVTYHAPRVMRWHEHTQAMSPIEHERHQGSVYYWRLDEPREQNAWIALGNVMGIPRWSRQHGELVPREIAA